MRLSVEFGKRAIAGRALMAKQIIDDSTIEACRRGDPDAFRLLFEGYKDRVYSIAVCFFDGNEAIATEPASHRCVLPLAHASSPDHEVRCAKPTGPNE